MKSRKPFPKSEKENFCPQNEWKNEWTENTPRGGEDIDDPSKRLRGFETASRRTWVISNRIRTRHCRTASRMYKWGLNATPNCSHCNAALQDTDHLVLNCPVTKLDGGYTTVDECGEVLSAWIDRHGLEM